MLKVLKYLKHSAPAVICIILLLCLQAGTDLTLPDYTSRIVNIGIQQSGIENVAPDAIREEEMNHLLLFTEDDDAILEKYTLVKAGDHAYEKDFPAIQEQDLYIKNKCGKKEQETLNSQMAKPLLVTYTLQSEEMQQTMKQQIQEQMLQQQTQVAIVENEEITYEQEMPQSMLQALAEQDIFTMIEHMPEEQKAQVLEQIEQRIGEMPDSILEQAAIAATKAEYEAIGIDMSWYQNRFIILAGVQMLGIALVSMVAAITIMFLSSRVAAKLGKNLRDKIFKKVMSFSTKEFREFSTASLITRSTNDIQQIQMLITMLFRVVVYAPIIGIGGLLRVIRTSDTSMAWIIGLAIVAIFIIVITLFVIAMPKFKILQTLIDKLNLVSREILTGLPVIRAFHTEKQEQKRFEEANKDLMKTNVFVNRAMSIMMPALMLVMNSIMILIIWVGGHNVNEGIMQVGDMMAFIQYTMQIVMAFLMISMISIMLPRAAVSANRINEVLGTKESIPEPTNPKPFKEDKKGWVEFKDVSFRYPDADTEILNDITFTAEPGKTTAIIGSTGSGKSTVINLIPRFYDVTGGELLIDGVNVKEVPQKELRKCIGFVPQKGVLFSGTIESNIQYGNEEMSEETMKEAARIAQATEFIEEKPDQYQSEIAQGGNNVSGGQKQRLSIARAIAKDPEIFVFDDSFSALDFKTDVALRTALAEKTKDKTVIIVAQRISTILHADQIIVLDEGKIVGMGTHEELMKHNETYRQIALSQLSKEELE